MAWQHIALGVFFALVIPAGAPRAAPAPLPPGAAMPAGPRAETWTRKSARLTASQVRLGGIGAHTHTNWILFRLPFDTTAVDRIRDVRFTASATVETNVSALRIGSVCTLHGRRDRRDRGLRRSSERPTADPTLLGIAVPTRVANYVACGRDGGHLEEPSTWQLDVTWEEI